MTNGFCIICAKYLPNGERVVFEPRSDVLWVRAPRLAENRAIKRACRQALILRGIGPTLMVPNVAPSESKGYANIHSIIIMPDGTFSFGGTVYGG